MGRARSRGRALCSRAPLHAAWRARLLLIARLLSVLVYDEIRRTGVRQRDRRGAYVERRALYGLCNPPQRLRTRTRAHGDCERATSTARAVVLRVDREHSVDRGLRAVAAGAGRRVARGRTAPVGA